MFLLGLPDGDFAAVSCHVERGVMIKECLLGTVFANVLPFVGNPSCQIPETDLTVRLAVSSCCGRVGDDAFDGLNGFFGGPFFGEALDDA